MGLVNGAFGDVDENAGGHEKGYDRGTTVRDKGEGDAGGWDEGEINSDVDEGLENNPRGDANGKKFAKTIGGFFGDTVAFVRDDEEGEENEEKF